MNQQTFWRAVPTQLELGAPRPDGRRQLIGRLMPYDTVADVLDMKADGTPDIYREGFRRGAFDGQLRTGKGAFTRIGLIHRHEGGLGYLGPFTNLREHDDGLWGDATILPTKVDDVMTLLAEGVDELSIEFRLRAEPNTSIDDDGVRWRTKVHLDQVALEPKGAYSTAQVMAVREEADELDREQAERAAAAKADEEQQAEAAIAAEREAAEAIERRRRWEELTGRIDSDVAKQRELIERYGVTVIGDRFTPHPQ